MSTATELPITDPETRPGLSESLYEVVDGRIVEKVMGSFEVEVAGTLFNHLANFAKEQGLGKAQMELLFLIDPARKLKRRPDVAFISRDRWPVRKPAPRSEAWDVVPDLMVEVVSPSNTASEVVIKLRDYFQAGVRLVWVVYPVEQWVYVYETVSAARILHRDDTLDGGEVIPGFRLALTEVFAEEFDSDPT